MSNQTQSAFPPLSPVLRGSKPQTKYRNRKRSWRENCKHIKEFSDWIQVLTGVTFNTKESGSFFCIRRIIINKNNGHEKK